MSQSIDDLLNALQSPKKFKGLENTADTWARIGNKDSFDELGLGKTELESFLTEWAQNNPYTNI